MNYGELWDNFGVIPAGINSVNIVKGSPTKMGSTKNVKNVDNNKNNNNCLLKKGIKRYKCALYDKNVHLII